MPVKKVLSKKQRARISLRTGVLQQQLTGIENEIAAVQARLVELQEAKVDAEEQLALYTDGPIKAMVDEHDELYGKERKGKKS